MTSDQIRQSFLDFFARHDHRIVPSAPVIPHGDPTLLFTNAGMNQFKDVFLGTGTREYSRAADTQKCIRVSGKHNDLEEVGRDTYHHTFFEMLGNWSFGDYYKREAIAWAWDLLTGVWGLEKKRLYATVFETDDEAERLWKSETDIEPSHILRFGKKDNFWEMGETGPCGPCSEIHVDLTPDGSGKSLVNAGDPRVMEIWNLVFIQYNRTGPMDLGELPARHVDTGMGFERIAAVLQGKSSNYDTDVFLPLIRAVEEATGRPYLDAADQVAMRVIADHIRMLTFAIADGALPGNDGRGYVLRRILRRAARFGRTLGMREPFMGQLADTVAATMGGVFPETRDRLPHIRRIITAEEESFNKTLDRGLEIFTSVLERIGHSSVFPGGDAFTLYDTYGFPLDLTEMMAAERGVKVDVGEFTGLMEEQRSRARLAGRTETHGDTPDILPRLADLRDSTFVGYVARETEAVVYRVIDGRYVALDRTPFYVHSGGQVDDGGVIEGEQFAAEVLESFRLDRKIVHEVRVVRGSLESAAGGTVRAAVDAARRSATERNHSATHLVHEALRRVLGDHLHQQGSHVAPDRLRFDFNHFQKITPDQLSAIEEMVNEKIALAVRVNALNDPKDWVTIDDAKRRYPNVKMFFGDKYGDRVRIVEIDPSFSVELCGGTHVANSREIGIFKIVSESGIASGIRRIEAVTGDGVRRHVEERLTRAKVLDDHLQQLLEEVASLEKQLGREPAARERPRPLEVRLDALTPADVRGVDEAVATREADAGLAAEALNALRKDWSRVRVKSAAGGIDDLVRQAGRVEGITLVSARVDAGSMDELKQLGDALRARLHSGVGVLGAVIDGKAALVAVVTDDLVRGGRLQAGAIVGAVARLVGGGGGGRPHLATAGGKDAGALDGALAQVTGIVRTAVSG
jgi:alanyl-tRNA synthetase